MASIGVTETELLQAIEQVLAARTAEEDDAFTTRELAASRGWSVEHARRVIRDLIAAGRVEPCQAMRMRMDGRPQRTSAYRLVREQAARKRRR